MHITAGSSVVGQTIVGDDADSPAQQGHWRSAPRLRRPSSVAQDSPQSLTRDRHAHLDQPCQTTDLGSIVTARCNTCRSPRGKVYHSSRAEHFQSWGGAIPMRIRVLIPVVAVLSMGIAVIYPGAAVAAPAIESRRVV